jgi:hypothetical protein
VLDGLSFAERVSGRQGDRARAHHEAGPPLLPIPLGCQWLTGNMRLESIACSDYDPPWVRTVLQMKLGLKLYVLAGLLNIIYGVVFSPYAVYTLRYVIDAAMVFIAYRLYTKLVSHDYETREEGGRHCGP